MAVPPNRNMPGPPRSRVSPHFRFAVALAIAAVCCVWLAAITHEVSGQRLRFQVGNRAGANGEETDFYGVYLPSDRTLSRGINRARERIAGGEFQEALAFLQQVLEQEEDSFIEETGDADEHLGLKATARKMIADLPPQGREMYQLLHSATARRQLEAAISSGDREALATLVRQYSHTPAGDEATLVLAQFELDRGQPLAAAHLYEQIRRNPQAASQFEPQLSVLAAVGWSAAGRTDRVAETLRSAADSHSGATIRLAGREWKLPAAHSSDADLVAWLAQSVGRPESNAAATQNWQTQRGDAQRNADHAGGAPHMRPRWQARVVGDPRAEAFVSGRHNQVQQNGIVEIPAASPIAVGDVVLMRTPRNVVAVDLNTGKRIWETREEEVEGWEQSQSEFSPNAQRDEWPIQRHPLELRIWDDSLTMSLSSDGQRVFVLNESPATPPDERRFWGMNPAFQGQGDVKWAPTNRLSAYELATEGKLAWEIDGSNGPADLPGTFFLGPPLAVNGSLFVLAEVRSAVYLLALDPTNGELLWRQQLAGLEQGIVLDPKRRLQGATPSYAAGMLICPTGSGMLTAVDVVQREFAWIYRYPRQVDSVVQFQRAWRAQSENLLVRDDRGWLDGSVIIHDGCVLLTPPESNEIYCLELASGKFRWKQPRDQAAFLACVDGGVAMLVGAESVSAIRVADGTDAWPDGQIQLPNGDLPAGLGYLSGGRYFLPLTSGRVVAIDVSDGNISGLNDAPTDGSLGNLICHRGSILSQSALFLDKYEQADALRKRANSALAVNPRDAGAIRDLAEMHRIDGDDDEAIRMLEQAHAIDPDDVLTRHMLAESLLEALATDFSRYQSRLPFVRKMIVDPGQHIDLLRIEAQGLQSSGDAMAAFAAYARLEDAMPFEPQLLTIDAYTSARSDCWVRGQLSSLWADANSDERTEIERQLDRRRVDWNDEPTAWQLRHYLAYFDGLPGSDEVRLRLARQLIGRSESLDVELELLKLYQSSDSVYQALAGVLLTDWLLADNRPGDARQMATSIADRWPDESVVDGMTGRQWLASKASNWSADRTASINDWPSGRIDVDLTMSASSRRRSTQRARVEYQAGLQRLRVEQIDRPGLGPSQWLVAPDGNRLIGRNGLGKTTFRLSTDKNEGMRRLSGKGEWIQAAQLGDLLYATFGGQIVAIDSRDRTEDRAGEILWRAYPAGQFPASPAQIRRRRSQSIYHPWSERRRMSNPARQLLGSLGPASPYGVVIQQQDALRRVDPLTGETLWSRSDIPSGCELFGDDEVLVAAHGETSTIYVINIVDGELEERRSFPTKSWMLTAGRNIARLSDQQANQGVRKALEIVDAASGKSVFAADYPTTARMATVEPSWIAVVEPPNRVIEAQRGELAASDPPRTADGMEGRFQLIDVRTGEVRIDRPLPVVADLKGVEVLLSGDQLFLMIDGPTGRATSRYIGVDYPLVDGLVYCFDMRTGEMSWPCAAVIERRGIALMQPQEIPLLVFVDRQTTRGADDRRSQLRLLCLDKRTGATIYRNDALPDTAGGQFHVYASAAEEPIVTIEMSARTVRLAYSDQPIAPEPPTNDRVEAAPKGSGGGLLSLGQRMREAIEQEIQSPRGTNRRQPGSQPNGDQGGDDDDNNDPIDDD